MLLQGKFTECFGICILFISLSSEFTERIQGKPDRIVLSHLKRNFGADASRARNKLILARSILIPGRSMLIPGRNNYIPAGNNLTLAGNKLILAGNKLILCVSEYTLIRRQL